MEFKGNDMNWFAGGKYIAGAKTSSFSVSAETEDTASKDYGGNWERPEVKKFSWEGKTENLFCDNEKGVSFIDLFKLMTKGEKVDMIFSLSKAEADKLKEDAPDGGWTPPTDGYFKGKVVITNLDPNATKGEKATYTATFKGYGPLEPVETAAKEA